MRQLVVFQKQQFVEIFLTKTLDLKITLVKNHFYQKFSKI